MANMKQILEGIIQRGGYDLAGILSRIDRFYAEGQLTEEDREQLRDAARNDPEIGLDVYDEIQRLWAAVNELRDAVSNIGSSENEPNSEPEEEIRKWIDDPPTGAHNAFYNGKIMLYLDNKIYRCIAPAGVACVWPPKDTPAYWELVNE